MFFRSSLYAPQQPPKSAREVAIGKAKGYHCPQSKVDYSVARAAAVAPKDSLIATTTVSKTRTAEGEERTIIR